MSIYEQHFTSLRISTDEINSLPQLTFDKKVTLVRDSASLKYAVNIISNSSLIGFDTESRPAFKKGQHFPVSLVQIATEEEAFLFQLSFQPFDKNLADILSDNNIKKVGIATKDDIAKLKALYNFTPANFIDLAMIAKSKGIVQTGARALAARYMGCRLSKGAQRTNWSLPSLTERQISYAALDAWVCIQILPLLTADNTDYHFLQKQEDELMLQKIEALEAENSEFERLSPFAKIIEKLK